MTEDDFKVRVMDTARHHGWLRHHSRPALTKQGWRTPLEGDPGLPDLVLARDDVVLLVELKSDTGYPTPMQRAWLAAAGPHARLWRPRDWDAALAELSTPRTAG